MKPNQKIVRLPSRLYYDLYSAGGDKLVAVYCHLKFGKDKYGKYYSYKAKNNKKVEGLAILRKFTSISLHSLRKYVPMLLEMDLCFYDKSGNFCIVGNNKLNERYKPSKEKSRFKLIPIILGVNITDTATSSYFVRCASNHRAQSNMIAQKTTRRVLTKQLQKMREGDSSAYLSPKALKKAIKIEEKFKGEEINYRIVSSNINFSVLKDGKQDSKQRGLYWKRKLLKKDLIASTRKYKRIARMSYSTYRAFKFTSDIGYKLSWSHGYAMEQLSNSLELKNSPIYTNILYTNTNNISLEPGGGDWMQ